MASKKKKITPKDKKPKDGRMTIGLAADDIVLIGGKNLLRGVTDVAQEHDANLLCFRQRLYPKTDDPSIERGPADWESMAELVDGLLVFEAWPNEEAFNNFRNQFPSLPMVSAWRLYDECPSLAADSYLGVKELIQHLIKVHNYRRIAFIAGPDNWAVQERQRSYVDTLAENDIPLDTNLITPNFGWDDGPQAISFLIDERKLVPGTDFEVIIASNDSMARGVLDELQRRGVPVPHTVAVVGFDDDKAAYTIPPLTTMRLPAYEIGRRSAEILLAQLAGEQVPQQTLVPPQMIIRRSCGCAPAVVAQTATELTQMGEQPMPETLAANRQRILAIMTQVAGGDDTTATWSEQLLDTFMAEAQGETSDVFWRELEEILHQVMAQGGEVLAWQKALSVLWRLARPTLKGDTYYETNQKFSFA